MFILSFKNGNDHSARDSFGKYYIPLLEIKDFNIFWSASKKQTSSVWKTCWNVKKQQLYNRKFIRFFMSSKYCKLIGIDLSGQTNINIPQQIYFVGKLEENHGATIIFCRWKAAKNYSKLFFRFINCNNII